MSQATQILPPVELSTRMKQLLNAGEQHFIVVPILAYPVLLQYIRVVPSVISATSGTYRLEYSPVAFNGAGVQIFIPLGPIAYDQMMFYNFEPAVRLGDYSLFINGNDVFDDTVPVVGTITIQVIPTVAIPYYFPLISIYLYNDSDGTIDFTLDLGYSFTGRGLDVSPVFYPGMETNIISSNNL